MDSTDKSVAIVCSSFFLAVSILIIALCLFYRAKDVQIAEMVKSGADPILASCAVDKPFSGTCELYFAIKK